MSVMIDALLLGWDRNLDYAKRLLADVPEDRIAYQPALNMNHPAWIFSHLNLYHPVMKAMLTNGAFDDPKNHRFGMQSKAMPDASLYASKHALIEEFERGHHEVAQSLRNVGQPALEMQTPLERWRAQMPQVGMVLAYLMLVHESTHLGQLSVWRRVQGMPSV
jgi:hypothetical protein